MHSTWKRLPIRLGNHVTADRQKTDIKLCIRNLRKDSEKKWVEFEKALSSERPHSLTMAKKKVDQSCTFSNKWEDGFFHAINGL